MDYIVKRNGRSVPFDAGKIKDAIWKAMQEVGEGDESLAETLSDRVTLALNQRFPDERPTVEEIQDVVEEILVSAGLVRTVKAYILYRKQREDLREMKGLFYEMPLVEDYLRDRDWRVREQQHDVLPPGPEHPYNR